MDKCPKCGGDSRESCEWELMYGDDGHKCNTRALLNYIRELTAEVQRLREAGWELHEASSNGELWKIYPARLRWQEVNPR